MKLLFKNIFFWIANCLPCVSSSGSILMYHSVGENNAEFTVSPNEFKKHLDYVLRGPYLLLSLSELVRRLENKESVRRSVSFTFDDGYRDMYEHVFPLITTYRIPITIFMTTGHIDGELTTSKGISLPLLTRGQMVEMNQSGLVEFLPHGARHLTLTALPVAAARTEILSSYATLHEMFGPTPKLYAYAKGKYGSETIQILQEQGFTAAVTVRPGLVSAHSPRFEQPRNAIDSSTHFEEFKARLGYAGIWYEWLKMNLL